MGIFFFLKYFGFKQACYSGIWFSCQHDSPKGSHTIRIVAPNSNVCKQLCVLYFCSRFTGGVALCNQCLLKYLVVKTRSTELCSLRGLQGITGYGATVAFPVFSAPLGWCHLIDMCVHGCVYICVCVLKPALHVHTHSSPSAGMAGDRRVFNLLCY